MTLNPCQAALSRHAVQCNEHPSRIVQLDVASQIQALNNDDSNDDDSRNNEYQPCVLGCVANIIRYAALRVAAQCNAQQLKANSKVQATQVPCNQRAHRRPW